MDTRPTIALVNLGTPAAPSAGAVRAFLRQFLSDPRVVELPRALWWTILNLFVLTTRPRRVARAYAEVWMDEGSPLAVIGRRQVEALQSELGEAARVLQAHTYGEPSLASALEGLPGGAPLLLLPLYPQYSATTTAAIADQMARLAGRRRHAPDWYLWPDHHDHPLYVRALAERLRGHWRRRGRARRLLLSFHGLPKRCVERGDPYQAQCERGAEALAAELELNDEDWALGYQSRFGAEQWIGPAIDQVLKTWGEEGLESVDVFCPGFAADCLETLEEIAIGGKALFEEAGGGEFRFVESLNDSPAYVACLADIARRWLGLRTSN